MQNISLRNLTIVNKLILLNIVIFVLQMIIPPLSNWIALQPLDSEYSMPYQYLTACFAHGGIIHIAFNMIGLYFFGPGLERKYGSRKFLIFYLFVGILANISYHIFSGDNPVVGASGAIYGVITLFSILFPDQKAAIIFLPFFPIKIKYLFTFFIVLELIAMISGIEDGIAHSVHIAGAVIAIIYYIIVLKPSTRLKIKF